MVLRTRRRRVVFVVVGGAVRVHVAENVIRSFYHSVCTQFGFARLLHCVHSRACVPRVQIVVFCVCLCAFALLCCVRTQTTNKRTSAHVRKTRIKTPQQANGMYPSIAAAAGVAALAQRIGGGDERCANVRRLK